MSLKSYIFRDLHDISAYNFQVFIARVGTWVLIFTNFVPISLLFTMEMVKYTQVTSNLSFTFFINYFIGYVHDMGYKSLRPKK